MITKIVDSWTKVGFIGVQIWGYKDPQKAFDYARKEYLPFGYNIAVYSTDIKTLFLTKTK